MSGHEWLELARRITARERDYRALTEKSWDEHNYIDAIRFRGIADGLELARDFQTHVIAEAKEAKE
jgi:hypothetical protein